MKEPKAPAPEPTDETPTPKEGADVDRMIYNRGFSDGYFDACSRFATGFLVIFGVFLFVRLLNWHE